METCKTCEENGFICSKTPLHLSYIFTQEHELGISACKYYGISRVQLWFLEGMADAERASCTDPPKEVVLNSDIGYKERCYNEGVRQWPIVEKWLRDHSIFKL